MTKLGEIPYMALLGYDTFNNKTAYYTCGGSVINKWYILTAAHCVFNKGISIKEGKSELIFCYANRNSISSKAQVPL